MKNDTTAGNQRGKADKLREKVGDATEQVQETASHIAAEARDKGEHLIEEGREKVHELSDRAGEMARSRADQERERVATGIRVVADALRRGSDNLSGDREQYRPLLNSAADRVEGLTGYLESRNIDALSDDVRRFARDHTPAFLAGAFALGFAGARFLKSSGEAAARARAGEYRTDYGYETNERLDRQMPDIDRLEGRTGSTGYGNALGTRTGSNAFDGGMTRGTTGFDAGSTSGTAGTTGFDAGADTRDSVSGTSGVEEGGTRRGGSYE